MDGRVFGGRGRGGRSRGGRGGQMAPGMRPVAEKDRIDIQERLERFRGSADAEMTFEAGLSNHDRAIVHETCRKYGLVSKSYGQGADRRVTVSKPREHLAQTSSATPLSFSPDSMLAIIDLLSNFPPTELELTSALGDAEMKADVVTTRAEAGAPRRGATAGQKGGAARRQGTMLQNVPVAKQMSAERLKLPIATFQDQIVAAVERNQVVLIAGQTGCGKTTQVPQFILDAAARRGQPCRIYCTQPRRISATSVAERIASERGESVGHSVGYQIRLETKGGPHCSLMLCTTGVLLRKLVRIGSPDEVKEVLGSEDGEGDEYELDATHIIVGQLDAG